MQDKDRSTNLPREKSLNAKSGDSSEHFSSISSGINYDVHYLMMITDVFSGLINAYEMPEHREHKRFLSREMKEEKSRISILLKEVKVVKAIYFLWQVRFENHIDSK
jgi:hypothetical protein